MAIEIAKTFGGFLKIDIISIDNNVFRLHYKITGLLLIVCSLLVTERQYIGDPIDCITDRVPTDMMDTFCWIHSTYTVRNLSNAVVGIDIPHPGVAPPLDNYDRKYHKYYQWVTVVLFLQAMLFYTPHYLWKIWEGRKMKQLVMQLNLPMLDEDVKAVRGQVLVDYYIKSLHHHSDYALKFFFCEGLNFVNVVAQIFLTDVFLGNEFTTYGSKVVEFTGMEFGTRIDPMDEIFPKVTKCTFHRYGMSATIERIDALCVLPINVLNEKIYIVLWFWFIILAVITGCSLIYRVGTLLPSFRRRLLESRARLADKAYIAEICNICNIGDWFILYQLAKNMEPMIFADVVDLLHEQITKRFSDGSYNEAFDVDSLLKAKRPQEPDF